MKKTNDLQMKELLKSIQDAQADAMFSKKSMLTITLHNGTDRTGQRDSYIMVDLDPFGEENSFAFYQFASFEDNLEELERLKNRINS